MFSHPKIALVIAATLFITGCASPDDESSNVVVEQETQVDQQSEDNAGESDESIEVDEGLFNVEITIPASLSESISEEDLSENVDEQGWTSGTKNLDGSVTYVMTKGQRDDYLEEMKQSLNETLEQTIAEEPNVYKEITYNGNVSKFEVVVDREAYENSFSFIQFTINISAYFYQLFDGVPPDNFLVEIDYVDEITGDIFDTYNSEDTD